MFDFDEVVVRKGTNCVKWDAMEENGKSEDVIPMWVADMDFKVAPAIQEALQEKLKEGIYGYSIVPESYYQAVISWMKRRHDFNVEKDWIVTTPGVVTALKLAVQAYSQKGDAILIHKPVYYPFDFSVELNERRVIENVLSYKDGHYELDIEDFEKNIKDNDVKLMILCNPHNPIGKVWSQDELYQMGMVCKKYGVTVVADEIHQDFIYGDHVHIPFYNVDESFKDFAVICTAPSKTFNLAGMQTSNIIIANPELKEQFVEVKTKNGVNDPNFLGILACQTAYNECELWVDEMLEYVYDNFMYLDQFLKDNMPEVKLVDPQGLYLAWVDFSAWKMSHEELEAFMLDKAKLWLDEGYIFGTGGDGFERFNLAMPRALLEQSCNQLLKAYQDKKAMD